MKKKKILGIICARAGSKGIKNKNLLKIQNKSLIEIAVKHARGSKFINRIIVSTDSKKISDIAKKNFAEVPFKRPYKLSKDDSKEWDVWIHALNYLKNEENYIPDVLVAIPVTSPLRKSEDIDKCIKKFLKNPNKPVISVTNSKRNPFFNMVKKKNKYTYDLVNKNKRYFRRQDAPETFDVSTIAFIISPKNVINGKHLFQRGVNIVKFNEVKALDIDTIHDYNMAKLYSKNIKF